MKKALLLLILLVPFLAASDCGDSRQPPVTTDKAVPSWSFPNKYGLYTEEGIHVRKRGSMPTQEEIAMVRESIAKANAVAEFNGYEKKLLPQFLEVYIELKSTKCQDPAFLLEGGSNYDQSEWDKDPDPGKVAICAAEQVWPTSRLGECLPTSTQWDANGNPIVTGCDLQKAAIRVVNDPAFFVEAAYNGWEHQLAAMNDFNLYIETETHAPGKGHPILSQPPSATASNLVIVQQRSVEEVIGPGVTVLLFIGIVAGAGFLIWKFVIKKK